MRTHKVPAANSVDTYSVRDAAGFFFFFLNAAAAVAMRLFLSAS